MLDLIWSAEFSDDTSIVQFDDPLTQTKEHAFKEVLDKQDKLQCFYLHNINSGWDYGVDLTKGKIYRWRSTREELHDLTPL